MRREAVSELLERSESGWEIVESMVLRGEISSSEFNGSIFYMRSF